MSGQTPIAPTRAARIAFWQTMALFVPLMLVASLSFAVSYYLEPDSIYTKKLRAKGELVTHNKDRSVMVFLNLETLIETNFSPVNKEELTDCVR